MNDFWIRFNISYLDDVDFMELPSQTKWHYIAMYLLAKKADAGGLVASNDKRLSAYGIARLLGEEEKSILESISLLLKNNFLSIDDSSLEIKNYDEEQDSKLLGEKANKTREQNKLRQEKHREKIKNQKTPNINSLNISLDINTINNIETDREIQTEVETEGPRLSRVTGALRERDINLPEEIAEDQEIPSSLETIATSSKEGSKMLKPETEYQKKFLKYFNRELFANPDDKIFFSMVEKMQKEQKDVIFLRAWENNNKSYEVAFKNMRRRNERD